MKSNDDDVLGDGLWNGVKSVYRNSDDHHLQLAAAGVAYNELFALFPAITAAISIFGLVADPAWIQHQMQALGSLLPAGASGVIGDQLSKIATSSEGTLSLTLAGSILLALYGATKGVDVLIEGFNIIHDRKDQRGFLHRRALSLALTAGAIVFGLLAISLIAIIPAILELIGMDGWAAKIVELARWPILLVLFLFGLAVLYRFGPDRPDPRWRWISLGSVFATLAWLAVSILFSWYVASFGSYNKTYGTVGAVMVLLVWLYLTGLAVLLGAEIDAFLESKSKQREKQHARSYP